MIFRDTSKTRKRYILIALSLLAVTIVTFVALLYIQLFIASGAGSVPYRYTALDDPQLEKHIALTFDDGPHPVYTNEIIDILKEEQVPATFFLLGENVIRHKQTARRVSEEGFEIGNHSYTHRRGVHASPERAQFELSAADHALRHTTGFSTALYRPPFLTDIGFGEILGNTGRTKALERIDEMGYVIVGADIDPKDWAGSTAGEMVAHVEREVATGKRIILLHDAGGSGETVEMLKVLIPSLKSQGYTFVPVSRFFGLARHEAMPAAAGSTLDMSVAAALTLHTSAQNIWRWVVAAIIAITLTRIWVVLVLRRLMIAADRKRPKQQKTATEGTLAVFIPAYNEAANIEATVRSVFAGTHQPDQVVVIDDGSEDDTGSIVHALVHEYGSRLKLFRKKNEGTKARALSYAIERTDHDFLVCIDGDTIVDKDALAAVVHQFGNEKIGAVAGKIYPSDTSTVLGIFQYLEYTQAQNLDKNVFALGNAIGVVPGAIGAWRRKALKQAGGYSTDTVVEDQDLTLALLAHGWRIEYDPHFIAYTETPATAKMFFRQRFRWVYGTLQCFWKYRTWIFSFTRPSLGWLVLPNIALFNIVFPLLIVLLDGGLILSLFGVIDFAAVFGPFLLFVFLDLLYTFEAFSAEKKPPYHFAGLLLFQRFYYRYVLAFVTMRAFVKALGGTAVGWGAITRNGTSHKLWNGWKVGNVPQTQS